MSPWIFPTGWSIPVFACSGSGGSTMSQATMTLASEAPPATLPGSLGNTRTPRSLWSNAWRQFRRNLLAMAGMIFLVLLAAVAIFAPIIAPHNPVVSDLKVAGKYRQAAWIQTDNEK